jgi:hypothetical protein
MAVTRRTVIRTGLALGVARCLPATTRLACAIPGTAQVKYVADNLGAGRGRLPDAAMRRRMEQYIDGQ